MTDISVQTTAFQVENRSWYLGTAEMPGFSISGTLDVSAFTPADHYPDGYVPSGVVLGRITATGLYGPYDAAAEDGTEDPVGVLFSSVKVPNPADTTVNVGCAILVAFAPVLVDKLPDNHGLDAAAIAALSHLYFIPSGVNA